MNHQQFCGILQSVLKTTVRKMSDIKTFAFLDLETTGLPHQERNCTKITEICCILIQADHLRSGVCPRVQNMINLCFNPNKAIDPITTDMTGLNNQLLQSQSLFSQNTVNLLNCFFGANEGPICLVAHNGKRFDYPILRAEINNVNGVLSEDILCIDSLEVFKKIEQTKTEPTCTHDETIPFELCDDYDHILSQAVDEYDKRQKIQAVNETTPKKQIIRRLHQKSYKLGDVYTRLTSKLPEEAHRAQGDVNMLITCASRLGDQFVDFANENSTKFCDVTPLMPWN